MISFSLLESWLIREDGFRILNGSWCPDFITLSIGVGIICTTKQFVNRIRNFNHMHLGLRKFVLKNCAAGLIFNETKCISGQILNQVLMGTLFY